MHISLLEKVYMHDSQGIISAFKFVNISLYPAVMCMHAITQLQAVLGRVMLVSPLGLRPYRFPQLNHYRDSSGAPMVKIASCL